jgi:hypothetical protein
MYEHRQLEGKALNLAENFWKYVVGTTIRFPSRPIVAQLKPRHTLATNERYSKFQISGESWESMLLWYGSNGATCYFSLEGSEFCSGRLNIAATI